MGDPNWLYSSVVQSSAAIVAIVGGFITSTLLLREAERETLQARIEERSAERRALEQQRASVERRADLRRAYFLFEDEIDKIVKLDPLPSPETARTDLEAEYISEEAFAHAWRALVKDIENERERLRIDMEKSGFTPPNFDRWAKTHDIDLSGRDRWLTEKVFYALRLAAAPKRPANRNIIPGVSVLPDSVLEDRRAWAIHTEETRKRELEGYRAQASDFEHRIAVADSELAALESRHRNLRYPRHLWWNVFTLGVLSITGILVPLLLMPQDAAHYRSWHKVLVIGGFLFGLVLVFGSVIVLAGPSRLPTRLATWRKSGARCCPEGMPHEADHPSRDRR